MSDEISLINESFKSLYKATSVKNGFDYWCNILLNKCLNIFTYKNLPDSLPQEEIELRLILFGYAIIFKSEKDKSKGQIVTSRGGISGIDKYYHATKAVYAQPVLGSGNLKIDENCVIIYDSLIESYGSQVGILRTMIKRYARIMADIESSIDTYAINTRAAYVNVVKNQQTADNIDIMRKKLELGENPVINEQSLIDSYRTLPYFGTQPQGTLDSLITARKNMLKTFLSEIGINFSQTKKERMITDEIESDTQILTINVNNMLDYRKKGIKKVNEMFNTKIEISINPDYLYFDEKGDIKNENNN